MTILHSCCWWRSVRRGTFASVFYTLIYFGSSCIIALSFLHDERLYLAGEVDTPLGESFLEKETISAATVIFNMLLLFCATCGLIASVLVVIALKCDRRELLVPWIIVMCLDIAVEFVHFIYLLLHETLHFDPLTATLYTIDMFIVCLNFYCLLCVISQYQELRAGRGRSRQNQQIAQTGHIMYVQSELHLHQQRPSSPTKAAFGHANGRPSAGLASVIVAPICTSSSSPPLSHSCAIIPEEEGQPNGSCTSCSSAGGKLTKKHVQFPNDVDDAVPLACDDQQSGMHTHLEHEHHYHHPLQKRQLVESFTCSEAAATMAATHRRTGVLIDADGAASAEETAPTTSTTRAAIYRNGSAPPAYDAIEWHPCDCRQTTHRVFDEII